MPGSRVYFFGPDYNIMEASWTTPPGAATGFEIRFTGAVANSSSALTSLFVGGSAGSRIYYQGQNNNYINELARVPKSNPWQINPTPALAAPSSPLACLYIEGGGSRVYYLDEKNYINELAWTGSQSNPWQVNPTPALAGPGSALTCLYVGGSGSRVYYQDQNNRINELAWVGSKSDPWEINPTPAIAGTPGIFAPQGSPLTCLYIDGGGSRVYYADKNNQINELAWDGSPNNPWKVNPTPARAVAGTALTCLYVGGSGSRVYYVDANVPQSGQPLDQFGPWISELAWQGGWRINGALSGPVTPFTGPTCLYVDGSGSRVYFLWGNPTAACIAPNPPLLYEIANDGGQWQSLPVAGVGWSVVGGPLTCFYVP